MKRTLTIILICIFASCFVFADDYFVYRFIYLDYEYDSEGRCVRELFSTGEESRVEYYPGTDLVKRLVKLYPSLKKIPFMVFY